MPEEVSPTPDPEQEKKRAICAYHDAKTKEEKRKVMEQFPILKELWPNAQ